MLTAPIHVYEKVITNNNRILAVDVQITHGIAGGNGQGFFETDTYSVSYNVELPEENAPTLSFRKTNDDSGIIVNEISPNPTKGNLKLVLDSSKGMDISIDLMNELGQKIKSFGTFENIEGGKLSLEFNIMDIPKGIYYGRSWVLSP